MELGLVPSQCLLLEPPHVRVSVPYSYAAVSCSVFCLSIQRKPIPSLETCFILSLLQICSLPRCLHGHASCAIWLSAHMSSYQNLQEQDLLDLCSPNEGGHKQGTIFHISDLSNSSQINCCFFFFFLSKLLIKTNLCIHTTHTTRRQGPREQELSLTCSVLYFWYLDSTLCPVNVC